MMEPEFEPEPAAWVEYDGIRFQVIDLGATAIYFRDGRFFRNSEADFRVLELID